jgi:hypothetical protein
MNPFQRAFLEAALWSSIGDNDEPLDKDYDIADFAPATLRALLKECDAFEAANEADLSVGPIRGTCLPREQAGHDFWLTRNGHGCGFWDGDWPEPQATRLTDASKAFGSIDLYTADGLVWAMGHESDPN